MSKGYKQELINSLCREKYCQNIGMVQKRLKMGVRKKFNKVTEKTLKQAKT
jgi:hypothetical protein